MSRERLHRLWCQPGFDPARHREVSEPMPIESLDSCELVEEWQELAFDQIVMTDVMTFQVRKDEIVCL